MHHPRAGTRHLGCVTWHGANNGHLCGGTSPKEALLGRGGAGGTDLGPVQSSGGSHACVEVRHLADACRVPDFQTTDHHSSLMVHHQREKEGTDRRRKRHG